MKLIDFLLVLASSLPKHHQLKPKMNTEDSVCCSVFFLLRFFYFICNVNDFLFHQIAAKISTKSSKMQVCSFIKEKEEPLLPLCVWFLVNKYFYFYRILQLDSKSLSLNVSFQKRCRPVGSKILKLFLDKCH